MTDRETGRKKSALLLLVLVLTPYGVSGQPIKIFLETISNPAERTLICRETNLKGAQSDLENAVFYLNGSDIRGNLTAGEYTEEVGKITFPLTQALEGHFTCGKANSMSPNSLDLAASLTEDVDIPRYYVQPVGGSVEMMCGILQGALWSLYNTDWIFQDFKNVEKTFGERAEVRSEELRDFSLRISRLELTDSGNYFCEVKVGPTNNLDRRESPVIILQVYQEARIDFLSSDQFHTIHPNTTRPPSVQFNCTATGSPGLQIQWSHNGNPIPSDSTDFQVTTTTTEEERSISLLRVSRPRLANSGNITCQANIRYRLTENGEVGDLATFSHSFSRSLIILDSSLEPLPYPTQEEDLLVRMGLPNGVTIPGVTQIRLKTIPFHSGEDLIDFIIEDVFFEGSRFYAFVPASRLKFRQFHVQVALVVDGETGPFSPANVSQLQYIDYDSPETSCKKELLEIVIPVVAGFFLCLVVTAFATIVIFCLWTRYKAKKVKEQVDLGRHTVSANLKVEEMKQECDKRHFCDPLLKILMDLVEKEQGRNPRNPARIAELEKRLDEVIDLRTKISQAAVETCQLEAEEQRRQADERHSNGGTGGGSKSDGTEGHLAEDGPLVEDNEGEEQRRASEHLQALMERIKSELQEGRESGDGRDSGGSNDSPL